MFGCLFHFFAQLIVTLTRSLYCTGHLLCPSIVLSLALFPVSLPETRVYHSTVCLYTCISVDVTPCSCFGRRFLFSQMAPYSEVGRRPLLLQLVLYPETGARLTAPCSRGSSDKPQ